MGQVWTTKGPDREGWWWIKFGVENIFIVKAEKIDLMEGDGPMLYLRFPDNDLFMVGDVYLNRAEFGSSPICEPASVKY